MLHCCKELARYFLQRFLFGDAVPGRKDSQVAQCERVCVSVVGVWMCVIKRVLLGPELAPIFDS